MENDQHEDIDIKQFIGTSEPQELDDINASFLGSLRFMLRTVHSSGLI